MFASGHSFAEIADRSDKSLHPILLRRMRIRSTPRIHWLTEIDRTAIVQLLVETMAVRLCDADGDFGLKSDHKTIIATVGSAAPIGGPVLNDVGMYRRKIRSADYFPPAGDRGRPDAVLIVVRAKKGATCRSSRAICSGTPRTTADWSTTCQLERHRS
jgi:hypothetical protein